MIEQNNEQDLMKRCVVISGRISQDLNKEVYRLLDGTTYKTKNDVLEAALMDFVRKTRNKEVEGC